MSVAAVAFATADPTPKVEVTITPPGGAVTAIVNRVTASQVSRVRGGSPLPVAGLTLLVDYEAPFDDAVSYTADYFDASGAPVGVQEQSTQVTLVVTDAWWSSPLEPALSLPIRRGPEYAVSREYISDMSFVPVAGRATVAVLADTRRAGTFRGDVVTASPVEDDRVRSLLRSSVSVVARHPASWDIGTVYLAAPTIRENRWTDDMTTPGRTWTVEATETAGPAAAQAAVVWTWDDVPINHTSWTALIAAKPTWVDVVRDPR